MRSIVAALALTLAVAACSDPAKDAPKAVVTDAPAVPAAVDPVTPPPAAEAPAAAVAPVALPEGTRYTFSNDGSTVAFTGSKVTGKHDGVFNTFSGTVVVPEGKPELAAVTVDITLASAKTDAEKLDGHLQSPDFFDVAKYPTANFTSTKVERAADGKSTVTGNLTLKGQTKQISFPAVATVEGDTVSATAEFAINRKDFGIVYAGKADDLIRDEVLVKLTIKAKKAA
ncbi:MAG TPA: YceI family protein [Myxococcota bacterium]